MDNSRRSNTTMLGEFIKSLGEPWESQQWLYWPPDAFALTSLVLKNTGAYRYSVTPPQGKRWPKARNWGEDVYDAAGEWWEWITKTRDRQPDLLAYNYNTIMRHADSITLDQLRTIDRNGKVDEAAWNVCEALLNLHALADQACAGFGLPTGSYGDDPDQVAVGLLANLLLCTTGTLSRLPKHRALVLPKMRTPQVGLTLRSLSHHLTLHETEVKVIWRTVPWTNTDEDTINIMIVPWPYKIDATWFRAEHHSVQRDSTEPARYFSFSGDGKAQPVDGVVAMLKQTRSSVNRIHVLVFPELALTLDELFHLKNRLASELERDRIPMIISGLRGPAPDARNGLGINKVVLSTFFGGKWYDLFQDKHHRWKLDGDQVRQYNLSGVLTGSREWWESIAIPERRITFMAPNGWLTLCPLICEDLARFEPVSELLRGVGPTLLIAILLDGPQLKERWSGRYASVLADDPGTSVLTVSSLGMARRSSPPSGEKKDKVIALWKDQDKGWREIEIGEGDGAAVITIAASWKREFTSDGRDDGQNAAAFILQNVSTIHLPTDHEPSRLNTRYAHSEVMDTEELTTFTYLVDASLDLDDDMMDSFRLWAMGVRDQNNSEGDTYNILREKDWCRRHGANLEKIKDLVQSSITDKYRSKIPGKEGYDPELNAFLEWFSSFLKKARRKCTAEVIKDQPCKYWKILAQRAEKALKNPNSSNYFKNSDREVILERLAMRVQVYSGLAILWAIHKRLATLRRLNGLTHESEDLLDYIEGLLSGEYDSAWYEPSPTAFIQRPTPNGVQIPSEPPPESTKPE